MMFCNRYTPSILERVLFSAIGDSFRFRKTAWTAPSLIFVSDVSQRCHPITIRSQPPPHNQLSLAKELKLEAARSRGSWCMHALEKKPPRRTAW